MSTKSEYQKILTYTIKEYKKIEEISTGVLTVIKHERFTSSPGMHLSNNEIEMVNIAIDKYQKLFEEHNIRFKFKKFSSKESLTLLMLNDFFTKVNTTAFLVLSQSERDNYHTKQKSVKVVYEAAKELGFYKKSKKGVPDSSPLKEKEIEKAEDAMVVLTKMLGMLQIGGGEEAPNLNTATLDIMQAYSQKILKSLVAAFPDLVTENAEGKIKYHS